MTESIPATRWLPRLCAGFAYPAADQVRVLIEASWLLMTEGFAFVEDVEGAGAAPDLLEVARIRLAELLFEVDCRMARATVPNELHHLPMLLENGFTDLADLNGGEIVDRLGLARDVDPTSDIPRVSEVFRSLLAAFPGELVNSLLPENQGKVIKALRQWNGACTVAGTDPGFLVPLMRAL